MRAPLRMFPRSWFVTVTVLRGGGGQDRWGNPLPTEELEVEGCLLGPNASRDQESYGAATDSDARIFHESFVFRQADIIEVPEGARNAGRWEVQEPSAEWPHGTETRIRRVNQS